MVLLPKVLFNRQQTVDIHSFFKVLVDEYIGYKSDTMLMIKVCDRKF